MEWADPVGGCEDLGLDGIEVATEGVAEFREAAAEVLGIGIGDDGGGVIDVGENVGDSAEAVIPGVSLGEAGPCSSPQLLVNLGDDLVEDKGGEGRGEGAPLGKALLLVDCCPLAMFVQVLAFIGVFVQEVEEGEQAGELVSDDVATSLPGHRVEHVLDVQGEEEACGEEAWVEVLGGGGVVNGGILRVDMFVDQCLLCRVDDKVFAATDANCPIVGQEVLGKSMLVKLAEVGCGDASECSPNPDRAELGGVILILVEGEEVGGAELLAERWWDAS